MHQLSLPQWILNVTTPKKNLFLCPSHEKTSGRERLNSIQDLIEQESYWYRCSSSLEPGSVQTCRLGSRILTYGLTLMQLNSKPVSSNRQVSTITLTHWSLYAELRRLTQIIGDTIWNFERKIRVAQLYAMNLAEIPSCQLKFDHLQVWVDGGWYTAWATSLCSRECIGHVYVHDLIYVMHVSIMEMTSKTWISITAQ